MPPAFSTTRQAAAFAILLAVLLIAPVFLANSSRTDRQDMYRAIPRKYGPFPWTQQKIFLETNDVDIAFMGSSHIWCGIHTPYVQQELSKQLGREAEVFTLGWPWAGFDALYFIARDLLAQRKVRMIVIYDEDRSPIVPHPQAARWFRIGNDSEALAGLDASSKISLYGSAVLGVPRTLLTMARPNLIEDPMQSSPDFWETQFHAPRFAEQLGAFRSQLGFNNKRSDFSIFTPPPLVTPADTVIYGDATRDDFKFSGRPMRDYQLHFAGKLAKLCRENGTRLVILDLPVFQEREQEKILERGAWPELLGEPVSLVGIPGAKLFAGISEEDVPRFFYNKSHLNQNGQDRFTPLITPALLKLYATTNF